jgi:hypothetical protein
MGNRVLRIALASLVASLVAGGSLMGCSSSDSTGSGPGNPSDPLDSARQKCVDTINSYRATLGLPPYGRWVDAEVCSDGEAKSDSETKKAHGAFGTCKESAQDECPGWAGPPETLIDGCLKMMWAEGPGPFATHGHYINMSSTAYTSVSCGFYQTPAGNYWAVQNFH